MPNNNNRNGGPIETPRNYTELTFNDPTPTQPKKSHSPTKKNKPTPADEANKVQHVPCKFYKNGACTQGTNCIFSHQRDTTSEVILCKYYFKGNCKFGNKCALSHGPEADNRKKDKIKKQDYIKSNSMNNYYPSNLHPTSGAFGYTQYETDLFNQFNSMQIDTTQNHYPYNYYSPKQDVPIFIETTQSNPLPTLGEFQVNKIPGNGYSQDFLFEDKESLTDAISPTPSTNSAFNNAESKIFSPFKLRFLSSTSNTLSGTSLPNNSSILTSISYQGLLREDGLSQSFQNYSFMARFKDFDKDEDEYEKENKQFGALFDDEDGLGFRME